MPAKTTQSAAAERIAGTMNGWGMLILNIALLLGGAWLIMLSAVDGGPIRVAGGFCDLLGLLMLGGYFTLQPNQARVLILFGAYKGTVRSSGFHWANPFYSRSRGINLHKESGSSDADQRNRPGRRRAGGGLGLQFLSTKLSLRAHNFSSDAIKVNDKRGNPVEIAAVVVWRVENTAQAVFDVEDYTSYVEIQSESAIRSIASRYAYDQGEEHELTLRGGADEVALALKEELQVRLLKAGVVVEEARLTHLAYAPEIAPVMLRRQQAEAIIAARKIIVQNAVSMVHMALDELDQKNVVKLDDERKAAMVSNLLVVLCGNSDASPVINTGTLYT
ncbi:MAG TPA: SPFH domain-containing protein [Steroidobacteraceae bacterium]|jgi:regulator of protease activity HflC (stomatin/prohibitin superfamily)